jgi:hypothetical protein
MHSEQNIFADASLFYAVDFDIEQLINLINILTAKLGVFPWIDHDAFNCTSNLRIRESPRQFTVTSSNVNAS